MFTVMTWNLENFERPAASATQATRDRYSGKLKQISELITGAEPDLVGVQEVLASHDDLAPQVFGDLLAALGAGWNGCLSQRPDERGIRVGWLSRGQLTGPTDVTRPAPARAPRLSARHRRVQPPGCG
jgi:Endonuclease/Exonuclease/phosphatase family